MKPLLTFISKALCYIGIILSPFILLWVGFFIYDGVLPSIAYRWVWIKPTGEIVKGVVYKQDDISKSIFDLEDSRFSQDFPRTESGLPAEDGLFIVEGGSDGYCASRDYRLNNEFLRIDHGNNDLTDAKQIYYQTDKKLLAWGNTEQIHPFNEERIDDKLMLKVYRFILPLGRFHEQLYLWSETLVVRQGSVIPTLRRNSSIQDGGIPTI